MLSELGPIAVVLGELLDDVGADVAVLLLDLLGRLERGVGLASVTEQRLHEIGDITTGDGDGLDGRADDIALCDGDDVGHTVTGVNDGTGERAVRDFRRSPRRGQCQDGLDSDIHAGAVEGLEEDLGRVLAVLGGVQGLGEVSGPVSGSDEDMALNVSYRLGEKKVVVFGLDSQVLEDGV